MRFYGKDKSRWGTHTDNTISREYLHDPYDSVHSTDGLLTEISEFAILYAENREEGTIWIMQRPGN